MSVFVVNGPAGDPASPAGLALSAGSHRLALHLAGIGALVFVLVTSGAFDSDGLSLGRRILMFAVISGLLVGQASLLANAVRRRWRPSLAGACLAVAATWLIMTAEIHLLKSTPVVPYAPDPLPEFALFLMPFVVPVSALVLGLKWAGYADAPRPARPRVDAASPGSGEVPKGWPRDAVERVQAVDHYLQLWTSGGTMLVRGRMDDALRWLPPAAGIRTHRSWWVALAQIDRLERRGRDHALLLKTGDHVPVARARVAEVKRLIGGAREP